jgi:hypothetical protein
MYVGVVPTQHPLTRVPGRGVPVSKHGSMNEGNLVSLHRKDCKEQVIEVHGSH